jgi:hypothetical protein
MLMGHDRQQQLSTLSGTGVRELVFSALWRVIWHRRSLAVQRLTEVTNAAVLQEHYREVPTLSGTPRQVHHKAQIERDSVYRTFPVLIFYLTRK